MTRSGTASNRFVLQFHLLLLSTLLIAIWGFEVIDDSQSFVVLKNATLIIGNGSEPIPNSNVIIKNERIFRIDKVGYENYPKHAVIEDLTGKWILPGFMDLHFHITDSTQLEVLDTLLRFGITTIRNAASSPEFGVKLREKLIKGETRGPRMLTAGELIDIKGGFWSGAPNAVGVETIEEIKMEVRRQADLDVDYIKFYANLGPDLLKAGIEKAKSLGIKTLGHLGKTGWAQAADMGIDALTHSGTGAPTWELVPATEQSKFKDFFAPHQKPEFDHTLFGSWRAMVDLDGPELAQMASSIVQNRVEINPTLVIIEVMFWGDDPAIRETYLPNHAPVELRNEWRKGPHPYTSSWPKTSLAEARKVFKINQEIVRRLHEKGALITTGTDFPLPWITPGVSLHREMLLMHNAGISALDVITIATRNGGEALGILDKVGTIETGKIADLVILDADPLENIQNTLKIAKVYQGGQLVYDSE